MVSRCLSAPRWLAILSLLAVCTTAFATAFGDDQPLTIGSDAPAIDVEHWVQNGNGKFKPVTKFEKGKVYVIEFWATWCGPCIASMPHIVQIQSQYADKGVQVVSISDEDLQTVEKFLERTVPGTTKEGDGKKGKDDKDDKEGKESQPQTYKDLTSAYCLTADPDRSVHKAYMDAAGQNGIPTAFIVGKDQKIEWVGHPMSMDGPLAEIVQGTWDRSKFAEEFKEKQEQDLLIKNISVAMRNGDTKKALAAIDEALGKAKSDEMKMNLRLYRLQIQLNDKDSQDQLPSVLSEAYKTFAEDPEVINLVASNILQRMERGLLTNKELLASTRAAIEKAAAGAQGERRAVMLNTAAHAQFLAGEVDTAIKTQKSALELATPRMKAQLEQYLQTLEAEKESAKESKADKSAEGEKANK